MNKTTIIIASPHNPTPRRARRFWTPEEDARLTALFPDALKQALCAEFGRPMTAIYHRAYALGLRRSADYLASPAACRLRRGDGVGRATRFKHGLTPWNKGMKGFYPDNSPSRFTKGHMPHNWVPIGTEVVDGDGYLKRKIADTRCTRKDWRPVHLLVWEEQYGPVPKDHAVIFTNRNKSDIRIENLELVTRAELMRRNSIHQYPSELKDVMRLAGKLKRTIEAQSEKQD